jgi:diguanylate cyclase (GGDEF)-like protein
VHPVATLVAAPAVTGAREAAVASLGIVILAIVARLAKPIQRFRHARLAGATAESALLLAGLGAPVRPPAPTIDPVVAITVLPSKAIRERSGVGLARELGEADAALAATLGTDHPVSAPGRHRTMPGWAPGMPRREAAAADVEALLAPLPAEPTPALLAELFPERQDLTRSEPTLPNATAHIEVPDESPRTGALEQENDEAMAETEQVSETEREVDVTTSGATSSMNPSEPGSRAQARYSIDWGEDLDWNEAEGAAHPDGWNDGWIAAHGEWWASPRSAGVPAAMPASAPVELTLPVSTPAPESGPEPAATGTARIEESATLAAWWGAIADGEITFETAADVIEAAATDIVAEPLAEPASEPVSEPVSGPVSGPVAEPIAGPVSEIDPEPFLVLDPPEEVDGWTIAITSIVDLGPALDPAPKAVSKPQPKPETKPETKPESKRESKPEPKPEQEPAAELRVPSQRHPGQPSVAQRDALQRAQSRLASAVTRIDVAEIITEEAARVVHADNAALVVRSLEGPRVLWLHPGGEIWGPQTLSALLALGAPVREVIDGDPLADGSATALLSVPMASAGALAGAVIVRRTTPKAFTAPDQNLLDRLARMAGAALDALTRRGVLRSEEENADPVTGLAPQDRLLHDLRVALRTREDHGMPVSLVVAEIDGIARMRTELGADEADEALQLIAHTVASTLRVGDVPYRLGEDELAVMLAATDTEDAELVAARLADEADTASAETFQLARPLRIRTAVVAVVGTAEDVVVEANRALAAQRVQARWERRMPNTQY